MNKLRLNLDELSVESFDATDAVQEAARKAEIFASNLNTCWDTNCGKTYCISSPCAC